MDKQIYTYVAFLTNDYCYIQLEKSQITLNSLLNGETK